MRETEIELDHINWEVSRKHCQVRANLSEDTIREYAEQMLAGAKFPPITVFTNGKTFWCADGFQREAARRLAGCDTILAEFREGTLRDAILFAVGANANHGLPRRNEDKRRAVLTLLKDEEWAKWSDREIARRCLVTHPFVASLRSGLSGNDYQMSSRLVERNGTVYEQNTANIGRQQEPDEVSIAELNLSKTAESMLESRGIVWASELQDVTYQDLLVEGNEGTKYADEIESAAKRVWIDLAYDRPAKTASRFAEMIEELERILFQLEQRVDNAQREEVIRAANKLRGSADTLLARAGNCQA